MSPNPNYHRPSATRAKISCKAAEADSHAVKADTLEDLLTQMRL